MPSTTAGASGGFRKLATAAAVTSLAVIALGGATRATDSGLACPTWPGCFSGGDFLPPTSGEFVDGLGRSVGGVNIWLEHSHRLFAGALAIMVAALGVWALARYRKVPGLLWPTLGAGVAVVVQALLGALVVWNLVKVELVTTHLGLGTATMALLIALAARARGPLVRPRGDDPSARRWRHVAWVTGAVWLQILVGGHLSGVHGGLAYRSDPALGLFSFGPITVEAEAVNVVHRYLGMLAGLLVLSLLVRLRRDKVTGWALRGVAVASVLVGVQIALGVANLASNLAWQVVVAHLAVASWILASLVLVLLCLARAQGGSEGPDSAAASAATAPASLDRVDAGRRSASADDDGWAADGGGARPVEPVA